MLLHLTLEHSEHGEMWQLHRVALHIFHEIADAADAAAIITKPQRVGIIRFRCAQESISWEHRFRDHARYLVAVFSDAAGLDAPPYHRNEHLEPELVQAPYRRQILLRFGQHDEP